MKNDLRKAKAQSLLQSGKRLFRNGLRYETLAQQSDAKGFERPTQIIISKAEGDYVWDLEGQLLHRFPKWVGNKSTRKLSSGNNSSGT